MTAEQQAALLKYAKVAKAQLAIGRIPSEGPQQPMQISGSFYLGVYEVIREQSQRVIGVIPTRPIDHSARSNPRARAENRGKVSSTQTFLGTPRQRPFFGLSAR